MDIPSPNVIEGDAYEDCVFLKLDERLISYYLHKIIRNRPLNLDDGPELYLRVQKSCWRCEHFDQINSSKNSMFCGKKDEVVQFHCDDFQLDESIWDTMHI